MTEQHNDPKGAEPKPSVSRRGILGGTAVVGAAALSGGGAYLNFVQQARAATAASQSAEVKPGDLDEYYGFGSSGQTGEVRVFGMPSMREMVRIPVFNRDSATGWGITNESRKILTEGLMPSTKKFLETREGVYHNGDLHHPHVSFTDGTYDGRYLFVNDKANCRVARIRLDIFKTDKIIEVPNASDIHGLRPQKYPRTGYVFANSEHIIPIPNDGADPRRSEELLVGVSRPSMATRWKSPGRCWSTAISTTPTATTKASMRSRLATIRPRARPSRK